MCRASQFWVRLCGLILCLTAACSVAQTSSVWKTVPPEELAYREVPGLPGATAVLLDRNSLVDDTKAFESEFYRIKILREEGRKFSDLEIPYVPRGEEISEIRARVIGPDGVAVEFQGEIFDKVIVRSKHYQYQAKVLTLGGVQVGSIIEYSYKMTWRQHTPEMLKNPQNFFFTEIVTVKTAHWTIQHDLFTRHARFSVRPLPKANLQWVTIRLPAGTSVQREGDGTVVLEVRNVPPLEQEEMMPPAPFFDSRIHFFYLLGMTSYDNNTAPFYWQQIARKEAEGINAYVGHFKAIERANAELFSPGDTTEVKLRKIYERVQQIRYVSYEPEKSEKEIKREKLKDNDNVEAVLNRGYGYGNQINDLFIAMVRAAGMEAYIVRVTGRDRHVFDSALPDAEQLDANVVDVHVEGKDRFFDPATRFCPFELIPWSESGVKGLRILMSSGDFISVPGYHSQAAITRRTVTAQVNDEGALESTFQVAFAGQEALSRRLIWQADDDASRRKGMEEEIKGWLPATARVEISSVTGWDTSKGDLVVEGKIGISDFGTPAGRRLLVPISIFHSSKTNPFHPDQRKTPVYFPYSYRTEDTTTLRFHDDLHVASLPSPPDESLIGYTGYVTSLKRLPDGVEVHRAFAMEGFIFAAEQYQDLKHFFDNVSNHDSEQIVLEPAAGAK